MWRATLMLCWSSAWSSWVQSWTLNSFAYVGLQEEPEEAVVSPVMRDNLAARGKHGLQCEQHCGFENNNNNIGLCRKKSLLLGVCLKPVFMPKVNEERAERGTGTWSSIINLTNVFLASVQFLVEIELLDAFKMTYFSLLARILLLCCYCWTFLLLLILLRVRFLSCGRWMASMCLCTGLLWLLMTLTIKRCVLSDLSSEGLKRV